MSERQTAAVILAAGASIRLGQPKQLIQIGGETLLDRAIRVAREAGCSPVVVVLGAEADRIRSGCALTGAYVILNHNWPEGMASSLRAGVMAAGPVDGVMLVMCDQPAVTTEHLRTVMSSGETTASAYANRRGIPAYFPASSFPQLLQLRGDRGARELLEEAHAVNLPGGELDIDTAADLERIRDRFGEVHLGRATKMAKS